MSSTKQDSKSRGVLRIDLLFRSDEIGVSIPEPHPMRAIQVFLDVASGEGYRAIAPRITQMPQGVLVLQSIANEPVSGEIYILDRDTGDFYAVTFDGARGEFTISEYDELVREYGLVEYLTQPARIREMAAQAAKA
jgi:hypothetical protein